MTVLGERRKREVLGWSGMGHVKNILFRDGFGIGRPVTNICCLCGIVV